MKVLRCNKCKKEKEEIEFEIDYFSKTTRNICKQCDDRFSKIFRNIENTNKKDDKEF